MKYLLLLALVSTPAFAFPGTQMLRCQSLPGTKAKISLELWQSESGADDMPAGIKLVINGKSFESSEEDSAVQHMGQVLAPEEKVFTARYSQTIKNWLGSIRLWAIPSTFNNKSGDDTSVSRYEFKAKMTGSIWNVNEDGAHADVTKMSCKLNVSHGS